MQWGRNVNIIYWCCLHPHTWFWWLVIFSSVGDLFFLFLTFLFYLKQKNVKMKFVESSIWLLLFPLIAMVGSSSSGLGPPGFSRAADGLDSAPGMLCSHILFAPLMCKLFARMTEALGWTHQSFSLRVIFVRNSKVWRCCSLSLSF